MLRQQVDGGGVVHVERPDAEQDQAHRGHGDDQRVDGLAPAVGPVDVLQVEPQRELVDGQPDAHAEAEGAQLVDRRDGEAREAEVPAIIIRTIPNTRWCMWTPPS